MKRTDAEREARRIAAADGIEMAVTFNPYGEEPDEADRFGFMPARAAETIFTHEKIVERIRP